MRIGLFTDTYPPLINGVSTSVFVLKNALENLGHEVFVVTVNNKNFKYAYEESRHIIRIPGMNVGIYDYRLTGIYPIRAIRTITRWHLDVIHSHTEFGIGTFARIIAKQLNIPLIHTYHTMYEDYAHYLMKGHFTRLSKKVIKAITLFYCDKALTELVVPTQKTYNLFKNKYKVKRDITIIPTGLELDRFYKEKQDRNELINLKKKYKIKNTDFLIMFIGRLAPEKSVDVLIQAHKELVKKFPNIKLLIVGSGPSEEELKKLIEKLGINDNVIMTGKVPYEEIPKYCNIINIFATASKSETQGLTLIEAMAASIPVVCVNDESFKIIVKDHENGYFFNNKKDYVKIITQLIQNPIKLESMSIEARLASKAFSSNTYALNALAVYEKAINKKKGRKRRFWQKQLENEKQ